MQRSRYFNFTRPTEVQLDYTESSKANAILRRARSVGQFGVTEGFQITVNSTDATKINIATGEGYTGGNYLLNEYEGEGSGERISTLTDAPTGVNNTDMTVVGQGLADYTDGTKNYVSLVYAETESTLLAERAYPFTQHNTIVTEAFLVSVMTETNWNALTAAQLNNRILVGIVTAKGSGVALTSADIDQTVQPKTHPSPTQPSAVTGVIIDSISQETPLGNATLRYNPATGMLYWTAPGDSEGTGIAIPSAGTYTLYSFTTTYWVIVEVISTGLPAAETTETIKIQSFYGRNIPLACAADIAHRDMIGSGVPSVKNPHATAMDDIEGGTFAHEDLFHLNGISSDADSDQLVCAINAANDSIDVTNKGGFKNTFLIDGIKYQLLIGYAAGTDGVVPFDIIPAPVSGDYLIYVDNSGDLQKVLIASYTPADAADEDVLWDADIEILDMHNTTAGQGRIDWNATTEILTWTAPGDVAGTAVKVMDAVTGTSYGIYKLYSGNGTDWIIVSVTGSLGATNHSEFTVTKNETDHADESILKLGIVTWNNSGGTAEIHYNLRDIRNFRTSDTKRELYEEHDANGRHTKVLQQRLRVYDSSAAIRATVDGVGAVMAQASQLAVFGSALNQGIAGYASSDTGVMGSATRNIGVHAQAVSATGLYASASTIGAYIRAGGNIGVSVSVGGNQGVLAVVAGDTGVYGSAVNNYGVYGKASAAAVYGTAVGIIGGQFLAGGATGIHVAAVGTIGGYFTAAATGVYAIVAGATGGYFTAGGNRGVIGSAGAHTGVCGVAVSNYGGFFEAGGNVGVRGSAVGDTGVYGVAANRGVIGIAAGDTGVYGLAGGNYGGYFIASSNAVGVDIIGAFGSAVNAGDANSAIGVYGVAAGSGATGVYGQAASGIGGIFSGSVIGLGCENTFYYSVATVPTADINDGPLIKSIGKFVPVHIDSGAGVETSWAIAIYSVT